MTADGSKKVVHLDKPMSESRDPKIFVPSMLEPLMEVIHGRVYHHKELASTHGPTHRVRMDKLERSASLREWSDRDVFEVAVITEQRPRAGCKDFLLRTIDIEEACKVFLEQCERYKAVPLYDEHLKAAMQ
jgi:hypothetical protein